MNGLENASDSDDYALDPGDNASTAIAVGVEQAQDRLETPQATSVPIFELVAPSADDPVEATPPTEDDVVAAAEPTQEAVAAPIASTAPEIAKELRLDLPFFLVDVSRDRSASCRERL